MNIIAGMMMPRDELRAEAGVEQLVVLGARSVASTSRWRPNTLTSAWPVNVSSIVRVELAGVLPLRDELLLRALARSAAVTTIETGTVDQRDQRQQRRDRRTSSTSTPTTVSSEVSSWLSVCCRRLRDVVDVVGDPAEQLAARLAVEVAQRQPVELVLDLARAACRSCAGRRR